MMPAATMRKVGLVKLALHLAEAGVAPAWKLREPVRTVHSLSRDMAHDFRIELEGRNWTTAIEVFESYFAAAERVLNLDEELRHLIRESRALLIQLAEKHWQDTRSQIDWAAKRHLLEQFMAQESGAWKDDSMRAFDLEYHNVDPEDGLYHALEQMGEVPIMFEESDIAEKGSGNQEGSRALARSIAVSRFREYVHTACWRSITFRIDQKLVEVELKPEIIYPRHLDEAHDVGTFVQMLRGES